MKARLIRSGSRGADVRAWQTALAHRGYEPGPIDGIFGDLTDAATRAFQLAARIGVDGVVGPETRGALLAAPLPPVADPSPAPLDDGVLPDATVGMWIHRLGKAIERAGGSPGALAADMVRLGVGLVLIKVADGRSLMNQAQLGAVVTALRAAGIRVAFWQWVYAVYYDGETGRPSTPYHATVEYVEEQARVLADQCRRHDCTGIVYANVEGEGAWSTTSSATAVFGPRNIRTFGSQAAADRAIAERADAYGQALEAELPGTLRVCSTHGLSWTQRLPWAALCAVFDAIAPQWYSPGDEGFAARVPKAVAAWRKLGARRVRGSGPAWKGKRASWVRSLRTLLRDGWGGERVDRGVDWWVYELMTPEQVAEL